MERNDDMDLTPEDGTDGTDGADNGGNAIIHTHIQPQTTLTHSTTHSLTRSLESLTHSLAHSLVLPTHTDAAHAH
jgi:hypothetical protein